MAKIETRLAALEKRSQARPPDLVQVQLLDWFYGDSTAVEYVTLDELRSRTLEDFYDKQK